MNRRNVRIGEPSTSVTLQKWKISARCPARKCMVHFSSLKQLWLATDFWTCWKTGCYPNWIAMWRLYSITGQSSPPPPISSHEYTSASQLCSFSKCKQPSPLATPLAGSYIMRFLSLGVRQRQHLCATTAHVRPGTSWLEKACTAGHYSGHATPSLGWVLITVWMCVVWLYKDFDAWETWTIPSADIVFCAHIGREIHSLLTFETAPFFGVCRYPS
jgi:hypothetical protein